MVTNHLFDPLYLTENKVQNINPNKMHGDSNRNICDIQDFPDTFAVES